MFLADSYLHTLDPFLAHFPEGWPLAGIRWYGTAYAVGFLIGWSMVRWISRRGWSPLRPEHVGDLMFAVIVGVLVGGRLGYALFYDRELFYTFSNSAPYWNLAAINRGGMSSHGGMIGVILAIWWFGARRQIPILHILDVGAVGSTPGLCLGRIANFINGELWGKPLSDPMQSFLAGKGLTGNNPPWWSIKYPQEMIEHWLPVLREPDRFPRAVVESAQQRMEILSQKLSPIVGAEQLPEQIAKLIRNAHEQFHEQAAQALKPLLTAYYPSQIFQAFTDGPVLLAALVLLWLKPRKPGVIGSWFLVIYGILRIMTEFFRQPDAGVALTLGLSRGQLLSLLMTLIGIACVFISSNRNVPKLGGLFARGELKPRMNTDKHG